MRHLKRGRIFGRTRDQRKALFRTLFSQLVMHGRIVTSEAKAKELAPFAERMITMARSSALHHRRILASRLPAAAVEKLSKVVAPRMRGRTGGYTRIVKLGPRPSDASRRAIIEFVQ